MHGLHAQWQESGLCTMDACVACGAQQTLVGCKTSWAMQGMHTRLQAVLSKCSVSGFQPHGTGAAAGGVQGCQVSSNYSLHGMIVDEFDGSDVGVAASRDTAQADKPAAICSWPAIGMEACALARTTCFR